MDKVYDKCCGIDVHSSFINQKSALPVKLIFFYNLILSTKPNSMMLQQLVLSYVNL